MYIRTPLEREGKEVPHVGVRNEKEKYDSATSLIWIPFRRKVSLLSRFLILVVNLYVRIQWLGKGVLREVSLIQGNS